MQFIQKLCLKMKVLAIVGFLALVGSPMVSATLEAQALWMIKCANQTMSTGLPAAGVPVHDPAVSIENFTYSFSLGLGTLNTAIWNTTWAGLPIYDPPVVNGTDNGEWVFYNWSIYWPNFLLEGYFDWNITTALFGELAGQHATFSINLTGVTWWGTWNMSLPKNTSDMPYLYEMTLESSAEKVETSLSGLGVINSLVKSSLELANEYIWNHFPSSAGEFLRTVRFNGVWLNKTNPAKLKAVLNNCGLNLDEF